MIVMQLQNVSKHFSGTDIIHGINLEIKTGKTTGIVGKNGAGKTTLMRMMAGALSYDGIISTPKGITVGYLSQQMTLDSDATVRSEMESAFSEVLNVKDKMDDIAEWLSKHEYTHPDYDSKIKEFESLQSYFETHHGYTIDVEIKTVLTGLNFELSDLDRNINEFSGGQKTRLALGKMLLERPDVLLLDEPTNHLDLETVEWLESYLKRYTGAIVIISHDRYFLDQTVDSIYEIEYGKGTVYHGNYSLYMTQKEEIYKQQMKLYEAQQKEIKKLETFVEKNIARASTSGMAKSRRKMLEHMNVMDRPDYDHRKASFHFDIEKESGNDVLRVNDLAIGYDDLTLNAHLNFYVEKKDRLAILGPNGIGKSTLIKTIAKLIPAIDGNILYGTNVSIGYYDQKQAEFSSNNTVLEELWKEYPHMSEKDIRSVLGQFLFSKDDVMKYVDHLSGGEKARIQISKLMLEKNNVLILDEPTNHLDINSKEVLEQALLDYPGTLIVVSHDRYFIRKIANRVMEIGHDDVFLVNGDYEYYLHKKEERLAEESANEVPQVEEKKDVNMDYQEQKERRSEIQKIERERDAVETVIHNLETQIETIELEMTNPEIFNDYEKLDELNAQLNKMNRDLETAMENWESAVERLSELELD
ncbi:ABC-F family ATP-binding cassette domain-containing protein [Phocicoccus schoeneichii]|uniref:ABC-F family ATP-binding cassette domain-containing protein n=1 Tax=Phocicoccus schoeneichii TaxID=1812261 RepID=UPI003D0CF739